MFGGFGQRGFAALGQAFENLSQIVAPEEDGKDVVILRDDAQEEEGEEEEDNDFEAKMRRFIEQRKEELVLDDDPIDASRIEPASPASSLVDVALDDESLDRSRDGQALLSLSLSLPSSSAVNGANSTETAEGYPSLSPPLSASSTASLSLPHTQTQAQTQTQQEIERRAQQKYRAQMESELQAFNRRYQELQRQSDSTLQMLQGECDKWRRKAESLQQQLQQQTVPAPPVHERSAEDARLIDELQSQCATLREQLSEAELQNDALAESNRSLSRMIADGESSARETQKKYEETLILLQQYEQANNALREESTSLGAQAATAISLRDENDARLQGEIAQLKALQQTLEEESLRSRSTSEEQAQRREEELQRLRGEAHELSKRVTESEQASRTLQSLVESLQEQVSLLNQRSSLAESEAQRWKELAEREGGEDQRESLSLALHTQCDELRRMVASLENHTKSLESEKLKLNEALQQSEDALKETEEIAWQSKAYQAELLFAFETEKADNEKLRSSLLELQKSVERSGIDKQEGLSVDQTVVVRALEHVLSVPECLEHDLLSMFSSELQSALHATLSVIKEKNRQLQEVRKILSESLVDGDDTSSAITAAAALVKHNQEFRIMAEELQNNLQLVIELDADKERKLEQLQSSVQTLTMARDNLEREKLSSQKQVQDQLRDTKAQLTKLENENKNLQVVISQLRNAGKVKSGENESVQQELMQLRSHNSNLIREIEELRRSMKRFDNFDAILAERDKLSQENHRLDDALSSMRLNQALIEKKLYEKSTANDILQSEIKMLKQDLSQKDEEVTNLHDALQQIQIDHRYEINHYKGLVQEAQQKQNKELLQQMEKELSDRQKSIDSLLAEKKELQQQCEDQIMLRRQVELSFHQEKKKLQASLEQVVTQMKNSTSDVIDRALITNLIVSYFQRRRSLEVLQLIAKVLCFSEEQLIIVGLKVAPTNIFTSIISTVLGPTEPVPVEGDNLAEMWVNYLMNEAEKKEDTSNEKSKVSISQNNKSET